MDNTAPSPGNSVLIQNATLDDLRDIIDAAVEKRIAEFYKSVTVKPPCLIKRKEAAAMLGVSLPTIDAYARSGILHAKHVGGRVFFDEEEIKKYKQSNR